MTKEIEEYGGLSWDDAKNMGFDQARALAIAMRKKAGKELPSDPLLTDDDFRCDAELVSVDKHGVVRKSRKP